MPVRHAGFWFMPVPRLQPLEGHGCSGIARGAKDDVMTLALHRRLQ
jgi:hypothetical protein